jgi:hypothetical protein
VRKNYDKKWSKLEKVRKNYDKKVVKIRKSARKESGQN